MAQKNKNRMTEHTTTSKINVIDELGSYNRIVEGTNNVFYKYSTKHGNLVCSANITSIIGYTPQQLRNNPKLWNGSIHQLDLQVVNKKIKSLKKNEILEIEYRFIKKNGQTVWLRDRLICLNKNKDEIVVEGFATDITQLKDAEEENKKNIQKYEAIFNQASDGIIAGKQNGKSKGSIVKVNNAILQMTGYKESELIGKDISFLFAKEDIKSKPFRYDLVHKGKTVVNERRLKLKNNKLLPIEMRSKIMTDGTLISFVRDISGNVESKKLIEESEKRYKSLIEEVIESSSVGIFILDSDFRIVWVNNQTELFFGIKKRDVIGKDKSALIKKEIKYLFEDPEGFEKRVTDSYKHNNYIEKFECHILQKGRRKERWLSHWSQPIKTGLYKGGRIEHYTDITDQKFALDYLKQSENKFAVTFKHTPLLMSISEIETGKYLEINDSFVNTFGYEREEIIGKSSLQLKFITSDDRNRMKTALLENGRVDGLEFELKKKNGDKFFVRFFAELVTINGQKKILSIVEDITEQRNTKIKLEKSLAELDAIYRLSPVMTCILDKNRNVLYANKAFTEFTGTSEEELKKGKACGIIGCINALDDPRGCGYSHNCADCKMRQAFAETYKTGKAQLNIEYFPTILKNGKLKHIYLIASISAFKIGDDKNLILTLTDISEQKITEEFLTKYKNIVSSTKDAISLVDTNYTYIIVNETYLSRSGLKREDIIGKSVAEYLGKRVFNKFVKQHFDLCLKGETINYQQWFDYKIAGKRYVDVTYFPYYNSSNEITGVIANSRDITDKKIIEDALKESEMRFRNMADTAPVLIWMSDTTKKCTYFNKVWLDFTGRKLEEELGDGWADGVHKDDLEYCINTYVNAFEKHEDFRMEYRLRFNNGSYKWVYDHGVPRFTEEGKFIGYIGSCIDVNEQREIRENYRLQSEMLQNMAEGTSLVSISDGKILYTNPSYNKMFGYNEKELIGKHISIINAQTNISPEEVAEKIMKDLKKNNCWQGEVLNKRKDGSTFWTYATVSTYIHSSYGEVWITAQSDITQQKEYELAQSKERKRLEILHDLYTKTNAMSDDEMYQYVIDRAVELTDSKTGFFHRIKNDQETIVLTAWSTETLKECSTVFENHYPIAKAGNWVECVRQRKPIVYNNFKLSPNQKGLPEGHSNITRMMSVPVIHNDKVKFIFGVGNKIVDYNDNDILEIQLVADELKKIIDAREARSELIESNKRLKEAEHIGGIGYYYFTLHDGKAIWSDETFKLFNRDPKLGPPTVEEYSNYIHPDDFKVFSNNLESAISAKQSFDFEYRILVGSEIKYLQSVGRIILDPNNIPTAVSGIVKDITVQRLALIAIKENEEKFKKAFMTSPDALSMTRIKDGTYIDVNDSFKRILGYEREEMIGKSSLELNVWQNTNARENLLKGLKEKGYVENLEAEFLTKSGEIIYGLMSARHIKFGDEEIILSITRDITERKAMEKAIRQSELRYKKLISNISDVIVVIDNNGKIVYKSSNIKEYFGWEPEDLIGKEALYTCHPDDYDSVYSELEILLQENNHQVSLEFNYRCKDGTYKPIELTAISLIDDPVINGIVANYRDISERKKAEKIIVETQRLGAIGEMSTAVAHDFNNSLQSIFGNLELAIMNLDEGHHCHRFLESIKIATTDAATRVKLLQRFAGTSKTREEYFELDVNQIVRDVIIQSRPMWKNRPEKEGIAINLEANYGNIKQVMGSEGELRSVLYNIIKNSVEAMPEGGNISITTYSKDNYSCIQLKDDGIGMDEETKSRIFQPFFSTKGFEGGRGMGMSGAYSILHEHHGKIYVKETAPNEGTTIVIELPVKEANKTQTVVQLPQIDLQVSLKILWIDDQEMIRNIAIDMIEVLGHTGKVLSNAEEALKVLKEDDFDLVLTDIGMPGINGWDLADKIYSNWGNDIKIGVVTGWGDQISKEQMKSHGVKYVLTKPFGIDDLKNLISEVIRTDQ